MPAHEPTPPSSSQSRPPFTSMSRVLCAVALAAMIGVMYWVIYNDALDGPKKLLAAGGVLVVGVIIIAAGAHFTDGRHRK